MKAYIYNMRSRTIVAVVNAEAPELVDDLYNDTYNQYEQGEYDYTFDQDFAETLNCAENFNVFDL